MDHYLMIDLHRELRQSVGYRGGVPKRSRVEEALCKLRKARDDTDSSRLYTVETTIFAIVFLVVVPMAVWPLLKAYFGDESSRVELPDRPAVELDGGSISAWGLLVGLLTVAFAVELLFLAFLGGLSRSIAPGSPDDDVRRGV